MKNQLLKLLCMTFVTSSFIAKSSQSFHYDADIIASTNMHEVVDRNITLLDLEKADYNITKFSVNINLKDPNQTIQNIILHRLSLPQEEYDIYSQSDILKKFILNFQKAEAEAVFYRDLKTIMDQSHSKLMGFEAYEKHRALNISFVDKMFDITEKNIEEVKYRLDIMKSRSRLRKVKFQDKEVYGFEKYINEHMSKNNISEEIKNLKDKINSRPEQ